MEKKHKFKYDIVCVDDEPQVTAMLASFASILYQDSGLKLKTYNYPTLVMEDLESGNLSSKVWLLDIMMPGKINGADIAKAIKEKNWGETTFVYAYTAIANNLQIMEKYSKQNLFDGTYNKITSPDVVLQSILSDHLGYSEDEQSENPTADLDQLFFESDVVDAETQSRKMLTQDEIDESFTSNAKDDVYEFSLDDVDIPIDNKDNRYKNNNISNKLTEEIESEIIEDEAHVLEKVRSLRTKTDEEQKQEIDSFEKTVEEYWGDDEQPNSFQLSDENEDDTFSDKDLSIEKIQRETLEIKNNNIDVKEPEIRESRFELSFSDEPMEDEKSDNNLAIENDSVQLKDDSLVAERVYFNGLDNNDNMSNDIMSGDEEDLLLQNNQIKNKNDDAFLPDLNNSSNNILEKKDIESESFSSLLKDENASPISQTSELKENETNSLPQLTLDLSEEPSKSEIASATFNTEENESNNKNLNTALFVALSTYSIIVTIISFILLAVILLL